MKNCHDAHVYSLLFVCSLFIHKIRIKSFRFPFHGKENRQNRRGYAQFLRKWRRKRQIVQTGAHENTVGTWDMPCERPLSAAFFQKNFVFIHISSLFLLISLNFFSECVRIDIMRGQTTVPMHTKHRSILPQTNLALKGVFIWDMNISQRASAPARFI